MAKQEEMFALIERWERSGMTKAEFAREANLSLNTFYYWCRRFEERQPVSTPRSVPISAPAFVEVTDVATSAGAASARLRLELPDGLTITIF